MRYFLELSYFGKAYHGWQRQPNAITVQQVVEEALSTLMRRPMPILGAGRTDAGVHAQQLFAHFLLDQPLKETELCYRLNALLPPDIAVKRIFKVPNTAHARFDAVSRSYEYWIVQEKNPFYKDSAYLLQAPLNLVAMNQAAQILLAYEDFECFSKTNTDVKTYLCQITQAYFKLVDQKLVFYITANRFLRNMVRAIVGTLLQIGLEKQPVDFMHQVIKSKSRGNAGASVPAKGLYLTAVKYPKTIVP